MSFPKDYHITAADETVSHAVARSLHLEQRDLTKRRKLRKLPKNMCPLKKAQAIAGSDLIMSGGDPKSYFMVAYFGAATTQQGGLGFGLGADVCVIDGQMRKSDHHTLAAVSAHAAARILGRTVHSADRNAMREVLRPALVGIADLWLRKNKMFKALAGHEVAVITERGALLGNVSGSMEVQFQLSTWLDAHSASGTEIPNLCHAVKAEGLKAIIAIKDPTAHWTAQWSRID
jgi:hypothetical protein